VKRGRKPEYERNLRVYQTLLSEGRTRGKAAVRRARELLQVHLADDAQIWRIIADGRRRHESGWIPPKVPVPPKVPFHLRTRLDRERLPSWYKKFYILTTVFHWLGRGLSPRRACRRAHKQLGIPEAEIIATYKRISQYFSKRFSETQQRDFIELAAQVTFPWMS
jgi:hypothetical protein